MDNLPKGFEWRQVTPQMWVFRCRKRIGDRVWTCWSRLGRVLFKDGRWSWAAFPAKGNTLWRVIHPTHGVVASKAAAMLEVEGHLDYVNIGIEIRKLEYQKLNVWRAYVRHRPTQRSETRTLIKADSL